MKIENYLVALIEVVWLHYLNMGEEVVGQLSNLRMIFCQKYECWLASISSTDAQQMSTIFLIFLNSNTCLLVDSAFLDTLVRSFAVGSNLFEHSYNTFDWGLGSHDVPRSFTIQRIVYDGTAFLSKRTWHTLGTGMRPQTERNYFTITLLLWIGESDPTSSATFLKFTDFYSI